MFFKPKRQHIVDAGGNLINKPTSTIDSIIKPKRRFKFFGVGLMLVMILLITGSILWVGTSAFGAIGKIITKNQGNSSPFLSFLGNISPDQLKGEGDSRINILLIGIGGANHPGGQLADTTMVMSIDPKEKAIAMLSIPRDLYVPIPGYGNGKINSAHSIGVQYQDKTGGGPELLKKTVSDILDLPIHYYIRIDFVGFIKLIDKLGGITVDVDKAISDPFYPDENMEGYEPFYIKSGRQILDGITTLKYARSRETTSDFDRARRQQQILLAIKDKTLNLGFLANPKKISDILKILGDHLRTDMQYQEMEKIFNILKDFDTSKTINRVLDNSTDGLLTNANDLGGYYLIPKTGINDFTEIQELVHEIFSDPYLREESAKIEILNASKNQGVALDASKMLKSYGYNIVKIADNDKILDKTIIYDYSEGKKAFTLRFLANRLNAEITKQPQKSGSDLDITILLGNNYSKNP